MKYKIKLKKGDLVVILSGKYKGKTGKISATLPAENKVMIDGINVAKKHIKPNKEHPQGAVIDLVRPVWVGQVALLEPTTKKPSRIGYKTVSSKKVRIYKSSGKEVKP